MRRISHIWIIVENTVKPVLSGHSKRRQKIGFQDRLSLNAGQKYCRMLQGQHSAILLTFIKLPFVIKTFFVYFRVAAKNRFYCNRNQYKSHYFCVIYFSTAYVVGTQKNHLEMVLLSTHNICMLWLMVRN